MRGAPRKSLGICRRVTNKGESGFGKASDRVEAKDHVQITAPRGFSVKCDVMGKGKRDHEPLVM